MINSRAITTSKLYEKTRFFQLSPLGSVIELHGFIASVACQPLPRPHTWLPYLLQTKPKNLYTQSQRYSLRRQIIKLLIQIQHQLANGKFSPFFAFDHLNSPDLATLCQGVHEWCNGFIQATNHSEADWSSVEPEVIQQLLPIMSWGSDYRASKLTQAILRFGLEKLPDCINKIYQLSHQIPSIAPKNQFTLQYNKSTIFNRTLH